MTLTNYKVVLMLSCLQSLQGGSASLKVYGSHQSPSDSTAELDELLLLRLLTPLVLRQAVVCLPSTGVQL